MPTKKIEIMALHLMQSLYKATDGRPMQYRALSGFYEAAETKAAVQLAVDRGWLLLEGGHSVALTDAGRRQALV